MSQVPADSVSTFGNWRRHTSAGLFGLGSLGTAAVLLAMALVTVLLATAGPIPAFIVAFIAVLAIVPLLFRRGGRNGFQRVAISAAWRLTARKHRNFYRSGLFGALPHSQHQLPGVLAPTFMYEAVAATGDEFGMIYVPQTKHYSVVLGCEADGAALVDPEDIESWVATWGSYLAVMAQEPGLEAASVIIDSSPDPGHRLKHEVDRLVTPEAPALAVQMLQEVKDSYPRDSAILETAVQLTYDAKVMGDGLDPEAMAIELGTRLPALAEGLQGTGASAGRPMTAYEITKMVRTAYDPAATDALRSVDAPPELSWQEAGPVAHHETWDTYRHDSGVSITWEMNEAPRGTVLSNVLTRLLQPHPRLHNKRVTLQYRPYTPAAAVQRVQADVQSAQFIHDQQKPPTARARADVRAASQQEAEEAAGAGLMRFSMLVTVTVANGADLKSIARDVEALGHSSHISLRRCYGSQSFSFACALPTGVIASSLNSIPDFIKDRT